MHSRQIAGWAMGQRADQALASAALAMALHRDGQRRAQSTIVTRARNTPAVHISGSCKKLG
ncbi:hypothetical protein, partial [Xanthomonas vesicatoria]